MARGNDELVRSSFDAFLRGDWDALAKVMDPGVEWLWYEPGDWDCHDRRKVLETLFERQREGVVTGLNDNRFGCAAKPHADRSSVRSAS
jgi:ketosteroid isomerase-like protein